MLTCWCLLMSVLAAAVAQDPCGGPCYGELGCFTLCFPWDIFPWPLGPERINTEFRYYVGFDEYVLITPQNLGPFQSGNVVFATHGFAGSGDDDFIRDLANELRVYNANIRVIVIHWQDGAFIDIDRPLEPVPATNTRVVAKQAELILNAMVTQRGQSPANVHCIGHSLGAHLCGFFGKNVGGSLGRISGLDPAGDIFDTPLASIRLHNTDASYVDAIHTNARGFGHSGIDRNVGDIDFWPHRGDEQPGCVFLLCHHFRANELFIESINNDQCDFNAIPCWDYDDMINESGCATRHCAGASCGRLGYHAPSRNLVGTFYLETNDDPPFCRHCCTP